MIKNYIQATLCIHEIGTRQILQFIPVGCFFLHENVLAFFTRFFCPGFFAEAPVFGILGANLCMLNTYYLIVGIILSVKYAAPTDASYLLSIFVTRFVKSKVVSASISHFFSKNL